MSLMRAFVQLCDGRFEILLRSGLVEVHYNGGKEGWLNCIVRC